MAENDAGAVDIIEHVGTRVIPGKNGGQLTPFTPERARAVAREREAKRHARLAASIRSGVASAAGQIPGLSAGDAYGAWAHIAEQHALNAADPSARGSTASARWLSERGWREPEREQAAEVGGGGVSAPALAGMLALFREAVSSSPELRARLVALGIDPATITGAGE